MVSFSSGKSLSELVQNGMKYLEAKHGNLEATAEISHYDMFLDIRVKDGFTKLHHNYRIDARLFKEVEFLEGIKQIDEAIQIERNKMGGTIGSTWEYEDIYTTSGVKRMRRKGKGYEYNYDDLYDFINGKDEEKKKPKRKPKKEDYKEVEGFGEF